MVSHQLVTCLAYYNNNLALQLYFSGSIEEVMMVPKNYIRTNTLYFQESAQDSFVFTVVFCTLSFINLMRVAYVVRCPCSDFTDMSRRHINCRIIIIIIIICRSFVGLLLL